MRFGTAVVRSKRTLLSIIGAAALITGFSVIALLPNDSPGQASRLSKAATATADKVTSSTSTALSSATSKVTTTLQTSTKSLLTKLATGSSQAPCAKPGELRLGRPLCPDSRALSPDPQTQPPLHGTNPHGQGGVSAVDINPSAERPQPNDTTGKDSGEDIVVGNARGEQKTDGTYHGHITIAALFGNEIVGVDSKPGESVNGPLNAVQVGLLTPLCNGTANQVCLSAVTADSSTTSTSSTNKFSTAHATVGGVSGVDVGAAESNGNISSDGTCQTSHADSQVATANVGGSTLAGVTKSSTTSKACNGGVGSQQTNTSSVLNLLGANLPIPAAGCDNGTPDTKFTLLAPLVALICNADDLDQVVAPLAGVREALSVFALASGASGLAKAVTASSESRAVAPDTAQCQNEIDDDGDGKVDFPADPQCTGPTDNSEAPQCSDKKDNDGDGKIDAADPGCHTDGDVSNQSSYNPLDNNEADQQAQCSDNRDNDGDGLIDEKDPGCHSDGNPNNSSSYNPNDNSEDHEGNCADGKDNDNDGLIDAKDPDCHTDGNPNNPNSYDSGLNEGGSTCANGKDDDGDNLIDAKDPDCHTDHNASNPDSFDSSLSEGAGVAGAGAGKPQCSDGIDNDGDGKVDFPADSDCTSASDNSEGRGALPFTGADLVAFTLVGLLLLGGGLALRRGMELRRAP